MGIATVPNARSAEGTGSETVGGKAAGKYLTFVLANEEYGIDVLRIQEILGMLPITAMPQTPDFVKGVVNLRGKVIPVVDLRLRFDMQERESDSQTCIIVVDIANLSMGVIVDTVCEVLDIGEESIEQAPRFGSQVDTRYIRGMGKLKEKIAILLDIEEVFSNDDISLVEGIREDCGQEESA